MTGMWAIIIGIGSAIFATVGMYFSGKRIGKAEADVKAEQQRTADSEALAVDEVKKAQAAADQQVKTVANANETNNDINRMSDADVLRELHADYDRPDPADGDKDGRK